ncbi:MAG: methyltransferase domain-containing protein [Planctomycetota bacterium]|nr:methyltransferase domain-containing protein [Planctomycetota bacterium]
MDAEQTLNNTRIEERHWWFAARRKIVRDVLRDLVPASKDALIIDIGCGTGGNSGALSDEYRCVGIDSSKEAVDFATTRHPHAHFIRGEVPRDLGPLVREARAFFLMDVLEHVADDFQLFSRIAAEASPGAIFVITTPAHESLWSAHDVASKHYRRYSEDRLKRLWSGLPITQLLFSPYNARLLPVVRVARSLNNALGRTSGDAGTDMRVPSAPLNSVLRAVFAGESTFLRRSLRDGGGPAFPDGVSYFAVLRRERGELAPRTKPRDVASDLHDPNRSA